VRNSIASRLYSSTLVYSKQAAAPTTEHVLMASHVADLPPAILIIAESLTALEGLERTARDATEGYDVLGVVRGADALKLARRRAMSLVIINHTPPGLDGLVLTIAMRAVARDAKMIFVTPYARDPTIEWKAWRAGADYFLAQPFPLDRLDKLLRHVL
jgi:two-component system response regulator (stage 0 sporulation protein F)